jgi:predicted transposase YbfD/YdcC
MTPEAWSRTIRNHWAGVEIRNHWTRDAILREDHTRSRNPTLVGALALLRSALLAVYARLRESQGGLPAILENLRANPHLTQRLITMPL